MKGAGTDANIYAIIHGDKGSTSKWELKDSITNSNKFENGSLDIFHFDSSDVGTIQVFIYSIDPIHSLEIGNWT